MTSHPPPQADLSEPIDWEALARYITGESSESERAEIGGWLAADASRAELVSALERSLARAAFVPPADLDVEAALGSVLSRRGVPASHTLGHTLPIRRHVPGARPAYHSRRWVTATLLAASTVLVAAIGVFWQRGRGASGDAGTAVAATVFETGVGARDSVRLPDGSRVVLGPGTHLALRSGYGGSGRELDLRGEAYFEVEHDAARPFVVHAGGATIRDLGTRFAVHGDAGDVVRVVVTGGSVLLRAAGAYEGGVVLAQGDRGTVAPSGEVTAQRAMATDEDLAWTRGRLVFRDAPMAQVRADVRRWYGIDLRIADSSLAGRHITTTFADDPPERVIEVIALALGASVERDSGAVFLRARSSGSRR